MNCGAIDIGTNAVLLLIARRNEEGLEEVLDVSTITRLGEGITREHRLSSSAMERTVKALEKYRRLLDENNARVVSCFGTSAIREAENREEFITAARERTGLEVSVFSEYEEAFYTYLSVKHDPAIRGDKFAIVDIGGGSTEIARATTEQFIDYVSVPVGTVKLTELFIKHDPPLREELEALKDFVRDRLTSPKPSGDNIIVGMAGTMTTLAAMILGLKEFDKKKIHGHVVTVQTLDHWIGRLASMPVARRRALPGMEPGREDLLLQGMILMREIVGALDGRDFVVSTYGARYGVMYGQ
jgi:exopolyphosphatase/guanosine-5'-triphosphate,3'-diphosphate pyrophosphatase